jgi:hypothetical protein
MWLTEGRRGILHYHESADGNRSATPIAIAAALAARLEPPVFAELRKESAAASAASDTTRFTHQHLALPRVR